MLTAWATAGILGPVVVNYMREYQLGLGIPREQVYNQTMYILVGMLVLGLICNLLIKPVADKWFMSDAELAEEKRLAHEKASASVMAASANGSGTDADGLRRPGVARGRHPARVGRLQDAAERGQVLQLMR